MIIDSVSKWMKLN